MGAFFTSINGKQTSGEFLGLVFMNRETSGENLCSGSIDLSMESDIPRFKLQSLRVLSTELAARGRSDRCPRGVGALEPWAFLYPL